MDDEVRFRPDLYRGSAGYYDRYRLPYPEAMIADLVRRAEVSGRGRLLDLACGTGQLAFPLRSWFCEAGFELAGRRELSTSTQRRACRYRNLSPAPPVVG